MNSIGGVLGNKTAFFALGAVGTGSAQTISHTLGEIPNLVLLQIHDNSKAFVIGTHTNKNISVTVDNGAVFDIVAMMVD